MQTNQQKGNNFMKSLHTETPCKNTQPDWGYDDTPRHGHEAEANDRLIVSAHDLREALENLVEFMRSDCGDFGMRVHLMAEADKVLNKVAGEGQYENPLHPTSHDVACPCLYGTGKQRKATNSTMP